MKNFTSKDRFSNPLTLLRLALCLLLLGGSLGAKAALSGSYTIDPSAAASATNYKSFTAAVSDLVNGTRPDGGPANGALDNGKRVIGPVTFTVSVATYVERISIGKIEGASSANPVTFIGANDALGNKVILTSGTSGSTNNYTLQLKGASYVTFSNMKISRSNLKNAIPNDAQYACVVDFRSGAAGSNNALLNCDIESDAPKGTSADDKSALVYANESSLKLSGNNFYNGHYAVYMLSPSGNSTTSGVVIENNTTLDQQYCAIYIKRSEAVKLKNNKIKLNSADGRHIVHLYECNNAIEITGNKFINTGKGDGLLLETCKGSQNVKGLIANNYITCTGFNATALPSFWIRNCMHQNVLHNSVLWATQNGAAAPVLQLHEATHITLNNNIIANTAMKNINNSLVGVGGPAISLGGNIYPITTDYNDLYTTGTELVKGNFTWNGVSYTSSFANLDAWQNTSIIQQDDHSASVNPLFTNDTTILISNECKLKNRGTTTTPSILKDITGASRDAKPDLGAAEMTLSTPGMWIGNTSSDWSEKNNWCDNAEPTDKTNVVIPAGTTNKPILSSGTSSARNLTIENGAELTLSGGALNLYGDLSLHGTFNHTGGNLNFAGSVVHKLPAGIFHDLTIADGGSVVLSDDITVEGTLDVKNGNLKTTDDYAVKLGEQATLKETSTSYVTGTIETTRILEDDGQENEMGGIGAAITVPSGTTNPGKTTVRRQNGSSLVGDLSLLSASGNDEYANMNRTYEIKAENSSGLNVTLRLSYNEDELIIGMNESGMNLFRADNIGDDYYKYKLGHTSRDVNANWVSLAGVEGFSVWTLGADDPVALPVELVSFDAASQGADVLLSWTTVSELNNSHFEVERSLDGRTWMKAGRVAGNGTTNAEQNYAFTDFGAAISGNVVYYRLKQVDFNGQHEYSEIRKVKLTAGTETSLHAWYDAREESIQVSLSGSEDASTLVMQDAMGRIVATQTIPAGGKGRVAFATQGLSKGVYVIVLRGKGTVQTAKTIIR